MTYWEILFVVLLSCFGLSLLFILIYSVAQIELVYRYVVNRKQHIVPEPNTNLPKVCIQLPIYNEQYVSERIVNSTVKINYPSELLSIQVLDDSTDSTQELLKKVVAQHLSLIHI